MKRRALLSSIAMVWCAILPAQATGYKDTPDWPCQQRKVTELALGTVWSGPDILPLKETWLKDPIVEDQVSLLSPRRTSLDDAKAALDKVLKDNPADANSKLLNIFAGLYFHLTQERLDVMKGIERFARKQKQTASTLKQKTADLSAAQEKGQTPREELAKTYDELMFETRIFEEREHSVIFVCEVPIVIEQRLFALGKLIQERMK